MGRDSKLGGQCGGLSCSSSSRLGFSIQGESLFFIPSSEPWCQYQKSAGQFEDAGIHGITWRTCREDGVLDTGPSRLIELTT
jgi:hypothetical protein